MTLEAMTDISSAETPTQVDSPTQKESRSGFSLFYPLDLVRFALERLWQHRVLVLWTWIGLTAAAALTVSLLLFVDAVNAGLLTSRLPDPPFAFRYRYLGVWNGNIAQSTYEAAEAHIRRQFAETVGLPVARLAEYIGGGIWTVNTESYALGGLTLGTLSGAESLIEITAGEWNASTRSEDDVIPVLLPETLFETMGVQVGDELTALRSGITVRMRVAALWRPVNARDPSWMLPPRFFESVILMAQDDLWRTTAGSATPVEEAVWSVIFDGAEVKTSDVSSLLARIQSGERGATEALPGIRLETSPVEGLRAFNAEVERLTGQLAITSLPIGGLTLYFVTLVAGLLVGRQANEDAVLASRGMSRRAILFIHGLMWLLLAGAALAGALAISPPIVQIVGKTTSFLRFNGTENLTAIYTLQAVGGGAVTALIAAGFGMLLSWRGSRQGVVRRSARGGRAWYQRAYLDVLLFIPAVYMLFTLWRSGGLTGSVRDPGTGALGDPLALAAPTLFSLSAMLLFLRVYPFILRTGSKILTLGRGIALLMALRELTRSMARYRGVMLMMGFTLALTGFTASMGSTLDANLSDAIDYQIGADAVLVPATDALTEEETDSSGQQTGVTVTGFNTLPAEDIAAIDGVEAVARVGRYPAQIIFPTERPTGTVLGIDRAAMAAVTRGRGDFSDTPYADLFNRFATNRTGAIINRDFARRTNLNVGASITVQISALNTWSEISVPIIGIVDYFPTLDPREGFFMLMVLDVVFETVGSELPHDLWIAGNDGADMGAIREAAANLGYPIIEWRDPALELNAALAAPLRRGVLGFLSVGFIAAVALTLIGAVVQNAATFRAQAQQIGVLRAMGLSGLAAAGYLLMTQGFAAVGGVAGGTLIGVGTTLLFLPVLNFSSGLPPYLVRVAWDEIALVYSVFGGVLLVVILMTTLTMSRQSLTALVKLGE